MKRDDRERGAVLIMTALIMLLLLFIAAFATDLGAWYRQGQAQQQAADVASLNGIQAYDRVVQDFFETNGVAEWGALSDTERFGLEEQAMVAALNTITGLLETSGYTFNNNTYSLVNLVPPPNNAGDESIITIEADDGTLITIVRSVQATPDGNTVSAMSVSISDEGEQYFSGLLRDAPEITRNSTAVLSNCGAICNQTFEIAPPFAGFNASGKGDGFAPLLFNKDGVDFNGYEEVWAVNHHVSHAGARRSTGDIICMVVETQEACLGGTTQFRLVDLYEDFQTGNRPMEWIDSQTGIMLIAGRDHALGKTGLACWDAAERDWCETKFFPMFDSVPDLQTSGYQHWLNSTGPLQYGNEFYMITQSGLWACAELSDVGGNTTLSSCGSGNTPAVGVTTGGGMPALDNWPGRVNHMEIVGNKAYGRQSTVNGDVVFWCMNLDTRNSCWGGGASVFGFGNGSDRDITFLGRNSSGVPTSICVLYLSGGSGRHQCAALNNGASVSLGANFNTMINEFADRWGGDAFYWSNGVTHRTFFAGGTSNRVGCWDWSTGDCDTTTAGYDSLLTNTAFTGSTENNIAPYAFAQVSTNCIIGLSHKSVFFSFNPIGMQACVETQVATTIAPCKCQDGSDTWGLVQLPRELLDLVNSLEATAKAPGVNGTVYVNGEDMLATGGVLDLSHVPDTVATLDLILQVDTKLDPNGDPVWVDDLPVEIEIITQPTLTG